jgi:hypothetical protein
MDKLGFFAYLFFFFKRKKCNYYCSTEHIVTFIKVLTIYHT